MERISAEVMKGSINSVRWLVFAAGVLLGVAASLARIVIKGPDYAMSNFNDIHFYTAMAQRLFQPAMDVIAEANLLFPNISLDHIQSTYSGPYFSHIFHAENGLSHQPNYAYRVLVPVLSRILSESGLTVDASYFIIYCLSAGLVAVSALALMQVGCSSKRKCLFVVSAILALAFATTGPGYPDMTYMGFALLGVFFARSQAVVPFVLAALLATLTRETGIILSAAWAIYWWLSNERRWLRFLPAATPLIAHLVIRWFIEVPNREMNLVAVARDLITPEYAVCGLSAIMALALLTPVLSILIRGEVVSGPQRWETVLWCIGVLCAITMTIFAWPANRMIMLCLPIMLAPSVWNRAVSPWWLVATAFAGLGGALLDVTINQYAPLTNGFSWVGLLCIVATCQVVAILSDRRRVNRAQT